MATSKEKDRPLEVSNQVLQYVACELTAEWLDLARYLQISEGILYDKKTDNIGHVKEAKYQMLLCWKRKVGRNATYCVLADALKRAGRRDLSHEVQTEERNARKRSGNIEYNSDLSTTVGDEGMTSAMKEKKAKFKKELRNKYKNLCGLIQPVPFLDERYPIDELFVQSRIVVLDGIQRESDLQKNWTPLENYEDIFTNDRTKSRLRIIDGEPGYGKTALTLKIVHDWCHEKSPVNDFEILILLQLSQCQKGQTIYSEIKKFLLPRDSSLEVEDIKGIIEISSILIILDGYDEYPDRRREETDINYIIRGDMFQEKEVILTTRTSCVPPYCPQSTVRIRLTGFDDEVQENYMKKVYGQPGHNHIENFSRFLLENPIDEDLKQVPLFFVTIFGMMDREGVVEKLNTSTAFFRHLVACFHSHVKLRGPSPLIRQRRRSLTDHSKLDKEAFEGLSANLQWIIWDRDKLRNKIGEKLYDEYVSIGILIEEEVFDDDDIDYRTQTRFFHKLFVEWFAAHHLAKGSTGKNTSLLERLDPNDAHFVFRFACGLSPESAPNIIKYLATSNDNDSLTMSCIAEWGGDLDEISNTINHFSSRGICITGLDRPLIQTVSVQILKYAADHKVITVKQMELWHCLSEVQSTAEPSLSLACSLRENDANVSLPVVTSLRKLVIRGDTSMKHETGPQKILQYSSMCRGLTEVCFICCMLPRSINPTTSMSVLKSRKVTVEWTPNDRSYLLNLSSGQWERTYFRPEKIRDEELLWKLYGRMKSCDNPKVKVLIKRGARNPLLEIESRVRQMQSMEDEDQGMEIESRMRRMQWMEDDDEGKEIESRVRQMQWSNIQREMTEEEYRLEKRELEECCYGRQLCVII
ncbi:hypothetical protein HOLleu_26282 [Holothuria leucospilota]|uniref:Death domain-containing protein n=1 Tax=Holothuria leucospilota TaxID=206669 RepID=A0A9Q1BU90_HOLLE|nr:hypothetical protein HOLleu_26282 [Holothuria leucospilota]